MRAPSYSVDPHRAAQARITAGFSNQSAAADALGINRVTLSTIENGKANVSLSLLERMSTLYDRSREYLLGEPEQVDEIEAGRERIAAALAKISEGFEDLTEVLGARVRDVREGVAAEIVGS